MRTSARILISLSVIFSLLGVMGLVDVFGSMSFRSNIGSGLIAFTIAFVFLILGLVVRVFSKIGEDQDGSAGDVSGDSDDEAEGPLTPLCMSCLAPAERLQTFCDECGAPLTSHAEIDPIGQIRSVGYMVSKAASAPPRLIVLIGIWLIFAVPVVLMLLAFGFLGVPDSHGLLDLILRLALLLGILSLYIAIVIKTTRNYFRQKSELDSAPPDAENIADEV